MVVTRWLCITSSAVTAWGRCHEVHMDNFEPQGGDSLHEACEGCGIREFGAKGRRALADGYLAVVEFAAQYSARLASEGDLISLRSH
jgi:hypothetical protein